MAEAPPVLFGLGMNAKIYQGTSGAEVTALTEMSNVKDVIGKCVNVMPTQAEFIAAHCAAGR